VRCGVLVWVCNLVIVWPSSPNNNNRSHRKKNSHATVPQTHDPTYHQHSKHTHNHSPPPNTRIPNFHISHTKHHNIKPTTDQQKTTSHQTSKYIQTHPHPPAQNNAQPTLIPAHQPIHITPNHTKKKIPTASAPQTTTILSTHRNHTTKQQHVHQIPTVHNQINRTSLRPQQQHHKINTNKDQDTRHHRHRSFNTKNKHNNDITATYDQHQPNTNNKTLIHDNITVTTALINDNLFTHFLLQDPSYITVNLKRSLFETTVPVFLLLLAGLYFLMRVVTVMLSCISVLLLVFGWC